MRVALAVVLLASLSSGCLVGSLHPVYDDDSIVFDERLLGAWENRESEISVRISRGEWRSYVVAFTDRFGTTRYDGHLTPVGAARIFNVRPHSGLEQPPFIIVTNGFFQVDVVGAGVRVREPEYAVVRDRAKAGTLGLAAAIDVKQNVVITASSAALRKWLTGALQDAALWADWNMFTRSAR